MIDSGNFRRDLLPCPLDYYRGRGMKLLGRGEWRSALCPFHHDTEPSLRVHVPDGGFFCHGCGAKGGDVLDFHQRRYSLRFREAAQDLGAWETTTNEPRRSSCKHTSRASDPVKDAARRLATPKLMHGYQPEALHAYRNQQGEPLFWVIRARHPQTGDKWIRPMHFAGEDYRQGAPNFASGKPLYNLDLLTSRKDETVVVCEGEKCADALLKCGVLATTSPFGAKSAGAANWRPLEGREVVIWPDHDVPGQLYATEVAEILNGLGCTVRVIDTRHLGLSTAEDAVEWLARNPNADCDDVLRLPTATTEERTTEKCHPHVELAPETEQALRTWLGARCRRDPRVFGGVPVLYRDYCDEFSAKQALTAAEFVAGLTALGMEVEAEFAKGLALKADFISGLTERSV